MNTKEVIDEITIVPLRELSYEDAKKEIINYLENAGKTKVYISEIVEKLRLDIGSTEEIVCEWRNQECRNLCAEDGFYGYTSYTCPVVGCRFNNYLVRK
jgi:hypothetical protein